MLSISKAVAFGPLLLLSILSANQASAEFGLGVSVKNNDNGIRIPYNINDSVFVELNVNADKSTNKNTLQDSTSEHYRIGFGAFGRHNIRQDLNLYYGARLSYVKRQSKSTIIPLPYVGPSSIGVAVFAIDAPQPRIESKANGYRLEPVVGASYQLSQSFSVAAEAVYYFERLDTEQHQYGINNSGVFGVSAFSRNNYAIDGKQTSNGLQGRIVLRYFF